MTDSRGSLDAKPWWRTRRAHSAPGPGGKIVMFCDELSVVSPDTGALLIDEVTVGFRVGSFTSILDPTGLRAHAFFLAAAGLRSATTGKVDLRSATGNDRLPPVGLITAATHLDEELTLVENLLAPLVLTGASTNETLFTEALALANVEAQANTPVSQLNPLDYFRALCARALACGATILLVEDPVHLPNPHDQRAALNLLRALAREGMTVVLATASPEVAVLAQRCILLADGQLSHDFIAPSESQLRSALSHADEDPTTLYGPIPAARAGTLPHTIPPATAPTAPAAAVEGQSDFSPEVPPPPFAPSFARNDAEDPQPPAVTPGPIPVAHARPADAPAFTWNDGLEPIDLTEDEEEKPDFEDVPFSLFQEPHPQSWNATEADTGTHERVDIEELDAISAALLAISGEFQRPPTPPTSTQAEVPARQALPELAPMPEMPTSEQKILIDRAKQILKELPGSVAPQE